MQIDHSKTIVELTNISFGYTDQEVIKNIGFSIHKGDYVGIIGPNGGGKSTLLKIMLGVIKPKSGKIKLFDQDITQFRDWAKIGYVAQKNQVFLNFPVTVSEVVEMGLYGKIGMFRFPTKEDKEKVLHALSQVDMQEFAHTQISDLSGGQQQRVFIARALVTNPEILFLDEPTVGVDIKTQKQFYALLRKLNQDMQLTLVLVSHELDVVAHEATELVYINRTIEYYGEPQEFLKGKYFHELIGIKNLHH